MQKFLLSFSAVALFVPAFAFAQTTTPQTVELLGKTVPYSEMVSADTDGNGKPDRTTYYDGDSMVLTVYDKNEDGKPELWLQWKDDKVVAELTDANADGVLDKKEDITPEERVVGTPTPVPTVAAAGTEKNVKGSPVSWIFVLAVAAVAVFLFTRARRR